MGSLDQGLMHVCIERPEQTVATEHAHGHGPDGIEIVAWLEPDPVVESESRDDELLPRGLVSFFERWEPERRGHREGKPFPAGKVCRQREHAR